jgi:hypothetical protein
VWLRSAAVYKVKMKCYFYFFRKLVGVDPGMAFFGSGQRRSDLTPLSRQARADDGQKPEGWHEPKDTVPGSTLVSCA